MRTQITHQWCPNCGAMLPAHLDTCPRCTEALKSGSGGVVFSFKEIMQFSLMIASFTLVPLIIFALIAWLCLWIIG